MTNSKWKSEDSRISSWICWEKITTYPVKNIFLKKAKIEIKKEKEKTIELAKIEYCTQKTFI